MSRLELERPTPLRCVSQRSLVGPLQSQVFSGPTGLEFLEQVTGAGRCCNETEQMSANTEELDRISTTARNHLSASDEGQCLLRRVAPGIGETPLARTLDIP